MTIEAEARPVPHDRPFAARVEDPSPGRGYSAPFVPQPQNAEETGLTLSALVDLVSKATYYAGRPTAQALSQQLNLPFAVVDEVLTFMKREQLVEVVGTSGVGEQLYMYALTGKGQERTEEAFQRNGYLGPAPVPFDLYIEVLRRQTVTAIRVTPDDVREALSHLVLPDALVESLGPAISSGKSLLLYGGSGNGKSTITSAIRRMLPGEVLIPYAVDIDGNIVKVFDPRVHEEIPIAVLRDRRAASNQHAPPPGGVERRRDRRFAVCKRPMVVAGGELTMKDLELRYSPVTKFYVAPMQVKANSGVLVIDDFGRQIVQPRELLNRWIVPMESGIDHLALHTGDTIEVPFDVLLVFSTNIPPGHLGDEAFFRRIRHKIEVPNPTREEFLEILRRVCQSMEMPYDEGAAEYLIETYYERTGREFRGCHPRDIAELIVDFARYRGARPQFAIDYIDAACASYFVDLEEEAA